MKVCITVDVERDWRGQEVHGLIKGIPKILKLFKKHKVKATFFVVAELLNWYSKEIKQIQKAGHEIACHSFRHRKYSALSSAQTFKDIEISKSLFEDCGIKIKGFRAPFLITNKSYFDSLDNLGFKYDSSKVNAWIPTRYNYLGTPEHPHKLQNGLMEVPISSNRLAPFWYSFPVSLSFVKKAWQLHKPSLERFNDDFFCFYFHPYEIVNERPEKLPLLLRSTAKVTGDEAFNILEELIMILKKKKAKFVRCDSLLKNNCFVTGDWLSHEGCPSRWSCKKINTKACKETWEMNR